MSDATIQLTTDQIEREVRKRDKSFSDFDHSGQRLRVVCIFDGLDFEVYRDEFDSDPDESDQDGSAIQVGDVQPNNHAIYHARCACGISSGITTRSGINRWRKVHRKDCDGKRPCSSLKTQPYLVR